jgi:predicted CDP-diglyceride synthetase/phosphatidate cytidylyltransferase
MAAFLGFGTLESILVISVIGSIWTKRKTPAITHTSTDHDLMIRNFWIVAYCVCVSFAVLSGFLIALVVYVEVR